MGVLELVGAAALLSAAGAEPQTSASPNFVWRYPPVPAPRSRPYLCNLGVVRGLRPGRRLLVRAGPARTYRVTARLVSEQRIYICNERDQWLGIAFERPETPCGDSTFRGLDVRRARTCPAGWVHRSWVETLTG